MTEYASLADLTTPRSGTDSGMPEDDVTLDNGRVVRVRGLSRWETLKGKDVDDRVLWEAYVVSTGMVTPAMTAEQVEGWQKTSLPAELEPVTDRIAELSGMDDGAERRIVRELVEDEAAQFRAVPSGSAENDARPTEDDAAG